MTFALYTLGFLAVVAFLVWANDRMEVARERQEEAQGRDDHLYAVAERAWKTRKPQLGTVDEQGQLTIREVKSVKLTE